MNIRTPMIECGGKQESLTRLVMVIWKLNIILQLILIWQNSIFKVRIPIEISAINGVEAVHRPVHVSWK